MKKKIASKLVVILVVLVAIIAGGLFYYSSSLKGTGSSEDKVVVSVKEGDTYYGLLSTLEENGLIKNATMAKSYLKLNGVSQLQVNDYELNKAMSFEEIIKVISTGDFNYLLKYKMTVPEGLTIKEIAEIVAEQTGETKETVLNKWDDESYVRELCEDYWFLNSEDILDEEIFHPLEGYLFPETYTFTTKEPTVDFVTRTMLDMTDQVLTELKDGIDELDFTVHEFLSFASVVERESLFDTDRPKIAGVFMHRLEDGWRLESDITVLYVLGRTGVELSFAEIDSADSPYNTYLYDGLPVGPISNISKVTMESCVNYVEMDEYFFYACPDGTVLYATTWAEHNANAVNNPW